MMSAFFSRCLICVMARCRKYPLPTPLFSGVWVFAFKGIWQSDSAQAVFEIALVLLFDQFEVLSERIFDRRGKHCVPVFVSLTGSNYDLVAGEINVFDPEPQTFHQSEASSVKEHDHEPIGMIKDIEDGPDVPSRQHDGYPVRSFTRTTLP